MAVLSHSSPASRIPFPQMGGAPELVGQPQTFLLLPWRLMLQEAGGVLAGQGCVLLQYAVQMLFPFPKLTQTRPAAQVVLLQDFPKPGTEAGPEQPDVSSLHWLHLSVPLTKPWLWHVALLRLVPSHSSVPSTLPSPHLAGAGAAPPEQICPLPKGTQLSPVGHWLPPGVQFHPQISALLVLRIHCAPVGKEGHGWLLLHLAVQYPV